MGHYIICKYKFKYYHKKSIKINSKTMSAIKNYITKHQKNFKNLVSLRGRVHFGSKFVTKFGKNQN